jgi:ankyrin repeat protein
MTAIHGAAEGGKVEIVRLLMENKADTSKKDANGKLPFDYAVDGKHTAVVKVLKEMGDAAAQSSACVVM